MRKVAGALTALAGLLLIGISCSSLEIASPSIFKTEAGGCIRAADDDIIESPLLTVLSINLAHGRGDALNQMLQKTSTTRHNLDQVAAFISDSGADIVALQEADAASRWSGNFNHVDYISANSPYPCGIHASHAKKYMYDFGTALLSPVPLGNALQHAFEPSPPTTNKGFVMGEVLWNPGGRLAEAIPVSIISVHLDFSRKKVREAQIEEMRVALPEIKRPLIILGDFNTDWQAEDSSLQRLAMELGMKAFEPEAEGLATYVKKGTRLDWILVSGELEFHDHAVYPDIVSDHSAVVADIRLAQDDETGASGYHDAERPR